MLVRRIGHELLTIIVHFVPILVSTLDPDAPAQRGPGLRPSILHEICSQHISSLRTANMKNRP